MNRLAGVFLALITFCLLGVFFTSSAAAYYNPTTQPNNRFGIHIIETAELDKAAELVNSSGGDWGYVVIVMRTNDRNLTKWQNFFDAAREKHLIPIIRLATKTHDDYWEIPQANDAQEWADFLAKLKWPTNNHYIIAYNEPNHAKEWGNIIDPAGYARELDKTITEIKERDPDAFILNAGFDASAPSVANRFMDQVTYMEQMEQAVPGIFSKLDGWSSHSYPQPDFSGSPSDRGRGTITTYRWERELLTNKFKTKKLPLFITETGWVHTDGITNNDKYLSENTTAHYFIESYQNVWKDEDLIAIAPFTLIYNQKPFDHFSWLRTAEFAPSPDTNIIQVLAANIVHFTQFDEVKKLQKIQGRPIQKSHATITKRKMAKSAAVNVILSGKLTLENNGESLWFGKKGEEGLTLELHNGEAISKVALYSPNPIKPKDKFNVSFNILTPQQQGTYQYRFVIKRKEEVLVDLPYAIEISNAKKVDSRTTQIINFIGETIEKIKERFS